MLTLLIDTAFEECQIGLWQNDFCIEKIVQQGGGGHDRILAGMVETLFKNHGINARNIDRIFVTTGPGRFTGLRVGIAFARGLALVNDTQVVGVSTLDALHLQLRNAFPNAAKRAMIVTVKRGESFVQYESQADIHRVPDEELAAFFATENDLTLGGVVSPMVQEALATIHGVHYQPSVAAPSPDALFEAGKLVETDGNTVARPYYAA